MLVLSRNRGQLIDVTTTGPAKIRVMVCEIQKHKVRIGIQAPKDVQILRSEIQDQSPRARSTDETLQDLSEGKTVPMTTPAPVSQDLNEWREWSKINFPENTGDSVGRSLGLPSEIVKEARPSPLGRYVETRAQNTTTSSTKEEAIQAAQKGVDCPTCGVRMSYNSGEPETVDLQCPACGYGETVGKCGSNKNQNLS